MAATQTAAELIPDRPTIRTLLGSKVKVMRDRGTLVDSELAPLVSVTVHPSSILRISEDEERHAAREEFAANLAFLAREIDRHKL
jgi:hypothetical protein